ncbi:hypothetical protein VP01_510g17 [Puccinia sorghi]|uniref:WLM domain-containing protein n=1 Tax=Puccinia sorghi TaxID=27349 RepID=A0A0L6UN66_9BASI|nr:hypothetical protein VP01_510g17 [Puccinia sorghi]
MATAPDDSRVTLSIRHERRHWSQSVSRHLTLRELCQEHLIPAALHEGHSDGIICKLLLQHPPRTFVSPGGSDSLSLHQLGFPPSHSPYPLVLLTTHLADLQPAQSLPLHQAMREQARQAALKNPAKVRSTTATRGPQDRFGFGGTTLLPGLPCEHRRQELVERLVAHPSIRQQMVKYQLSVGLLGELHPWLHPQLLGVNFNAGRSIRLRLLTDDLNHQFKQLDSAIHKGMLAYDERLKASSYRLGGDLGEHYEPDSIELDLHCSTSSHSQSSLTLGPHQPPELDPRRAAAEAAIKRASQNK